MAEHPTLWLPSANEAQYGTDGTESGEIGALIAQADFLFSAVTDEIERARDLRVGYWWRKRRRLRT
jgi:hypothetical protein